MITKDDYAKLTLRLGIAAVFLWFGINQLLLSEDFIGYLPGFIFDLVSGDLTWIVMINGTFEVIVATLLIIGWKTRVMANLFAVHLGIIVLILGYNEIAVRDVGLMAACISLALGHPDPWTLDSCNQ